MLTIFANMMINDRGRLQHLYDSCRSFKDISDNWLINIRGTLREEALEFLRRELGDKMIEFKLLDENRGWFNNALEMLTLAKYDYILIWCEDHLNLMTPETYRDIIGEMRRENVDYLMYSWWLGGKSRQAFEVPELKKHQHIDTLELTKEIWQRQLENGHNDYLISLISIMKRDFFIRVLNRENNKWPRWITTNIFRVMIGLRFLGLKFHHRYWFDTINGWLGGKLTKFPPDRPFDIEKSGYRLDILPFKLALPRQELFACIDDDLGVEGYQLIKRGLYPLANNFQKNGAGVEYNDYGSYELLSEDHGYRVEKHQLKAGQSYSQTGFPAANRIEQLPLATAVNLGNDLLFKSRGGQVVLGGGESLKFYPNINYQFVAESNDCSFIIVWPEIISKNK